MNRWIHLTFAPLVTLAIGLLVFTQTLVAQAPKPVADAPAPKAATELRGPQEQNAKLFQDLKRGLLVLAQKLEKSDRQEDKDRSKTIRAALDVAEKANVDNQFKNLITGLSKGSNKIQDVDQLLGQNGELAKALQEMLNILMTDDESARLKAEIEKLERFLKDAESLKRREEIIRAMTESAKGDPKKIEKNQADVAADTKDLIDRMGGKKPEGKPGTPAGPKPDPKSQPKSDAKPGESSAEPKADTKDAKSGDKGEPKPGEADGEAKPAKPKDDAGKPKPSKDDEAKAGEPKPGEPKAGEPKAEPKPGEPKARPPAESKDASKGKGEGKPSEGKPGGEAKGKGSDAKPSDQEASSKGGGQPPPPGEAPPPQANPPQAPPGRKNVEEAYPQQKGAEEDLKKDDRNAAAKKEDKAIEALAKAIDELKKKLNQLREEEMLKTLAALEARCNRMLAMQKEVYESTKLIHSVIVKNGNEKTTADRQKSQQQGDKETEIIAEAEKALKLLESEGSAVAFARVLEEVKGDMQSVQRRLLECYVDTDTQQIEENIIAMLDDMVKALKKAQQDIQSGQSQSKPSNNKPQNKKLIDLLAELRLIRAFQIQVNSRTLMYGKKYQGEQASDAIIQTELRQISLRQAKLQDMVQKIATGANQ